MPRPLVYFLYNVLLPAILILGLPSFLIKGIRRGGLSRNFLQRLGFFSNKTFSTFKGKKPIWIHAVSVGEVFLALKLIEALRTTKPGRLIVLSTTTTTGYRVAAEKESDTLTVIHNPVDLPWIASSVLNKIDPCALVLIEAEIWPNLIGLAKRRGLPVLLANARLSTRSERRYKKFRGLIQPIFSLLDGVSVPFDEDVARWTSLGIPAERVVVTGSIKFDHSVSAASDEKLREELTNWLTDTEMPATRRILLGASTHSGEELLLAATTRALQGEFPELRLVLVPRHAERGKEVTAVLRDAGFDPILRVGAAKTDSTAGKAPNERVWIANTTGELRAWFHHAEIVVIGKSFHVTGGQNPVEPILAGRPVIVGPNMENFTDVVGELLRVGGIRQLDGQEALGESIRTLLLAPSEGLAMAASGAAAMARHAGSALRNSRWIDSKFETD